MTDHVSKSFSLCLSQPSPPAGTCLALSNRQQLLACLTCYYLFRLFTSMCLLSSPSPSPFPSPSPSSSPSPPSFPFALLLHLNHSTFHALHLNLHQLTSQKSSSFCPRPCNTSMVHERRIKLHGYHDRSNCASAGVPPVITIHARVVTCCTFL